MPRKKKAAKKKDGDVENEIEWKDSKARKLLFKDLKNGAIPLVAFNILPNGKRQYTQPRIKQIYEMHDEYKEYDYKKFSRRVGSARKTVRKAIQRKADDAAAFQNFVDQNEIVHFSHKGYVQWKGSDAQKLSKKHTKDDMHGRMTYRQIYERYAEYHENFPFQAFKDHYRSEIRLGKYIQHRKDFGETHKTGKPQPEPDSDDE